MSGGSPSRAGAPVSKLDPERAALVVIDVQEGFRVAVGDFARIAAATATMVRGARELGLPVIITEQYPKGLGRTAPEVAEHLPEGVEPIAKTCFSAAEAEGFDLAGREQAIVCGIEAHVCVNQTVLDLLGSGAEVHVVEDAVGSRSAENRALGLAKAERAGAWRTSVETALFELLRGAPAAGSGRDRFKAIQRLVLEYAP